MDWSHEVVESLIWLGKAFGITLLAGTAVGWLLIRYTQWGKQFWRIAQYALLGAQLSKSVGLILLFLFLQLFAVRLNVLLSYWNNDFYTAAQKLDGPGFWFSIRLFCLLATIHVLRFLFALFIKQHLIIHWRSTINKKLVNAWLEGQTYYKSYFIDIQQDNPEQRIQQDVDDYVEISAKLSVDLLRAAVSLFEFTIILWSLSAAMTIAGFTIPHAMVFLVLIYVGFATAFAFKLGRPLINLNFILESLNASYRYALTRVREHGESVAFYRGEHVEKSGLLHLFNGIIKNKWDIFFRQLKFDGWNLSFNQAAVIFPYIVQGPRLLSQQIQLGAVMQTGSAFGEVHESLSFFRNAYDDFARFRAILTRLTGFLDVAQQVNKLPTLKPEMVGTVFKLSNFDISTPHGHTLVQNLALEMTNGQSLLVRGNSGSGKTTLLRSIAGLWPFATGQIQLPEQVTTLFLSQKPYLPIGTLRTALYYPGEAVEGPDAAKVLEQVQLGHLAGRLDEEADWSRILSLGEQQRLAFGRALLAQPALLFLDEATSAMDEGLEHAMYQLLRDQLPQCILVSVGHRSTLRPFHQQELELTGEGGWQLHALQ